MHHDGVSRASLEGRAPTASRRVAFRLILWAVVYALLLLAYNIGYARVAPLLVYALQIAPAAWIIGLARPDASVMATGHTIRTPEVRIELMRGCDGVEGWLILVTALLVFPLRARDRVGGLLLGSALMFGLNITRIVSLYLIGLHRPAWFDLAHGLVWQTLMTLAAAGFALYWMSPRTHHRQTGSG